MDQTELYTRMSDCPEVQGQRKKFEDGDVLASYRQVWKQVDKDTQKASRSFDGMVLYCEGFTHVHERDLVIWLPRQDQIQKMIPKLDNFQKIYELAKYAERNDARYLMGEENRSLKQLWLSFYMYRQHGKIWVENKWIKI